MCFLGGFTQAIGYGGAGAQLKAATAGLSVGSYVQMSPRSEPEAGGSSDPSPTAAASLVPSAFEDRVCQFCTPGVVCSFHVAPLFSDNHMLPVLVVSPGSPPTAAINTVPSLLLATLRQC